MDIKACTENLLESSDFDYTILQGAAFMQGVISQFAIPVLEVRPSGSVAVRRPSPT